MCPPDITDILHHNPAGGRLSARAAGARDESAGGSEEDNHRV